MDSPRLIEDIEGAEGFRRKAYRDTEGYWTAGYGHFLDQSKDWTGVEFSTATIRTWLEQDIATAVSEAQKLPEWKALNTDARQNAVAELVFNMGLAKWKGFHHCRNSLELAHWLPAGAQLLDSAWDHEVGRNRSQRLYNYITTGDFQCSSQ